MQAGIPVLFFPLLPTMIGTDRKGMEGMKKFAVFSGFLGSGKTTTMIALTQYYTAHHGKAAMISNDLGEGVTLADDRLARLSGANASQITTSASASAMMC